MSAEETQRVHGVSKPWYQRGSGKYLSNAREIVERYFPSLQFSFDPEREIAKLSGHIRLVADCGVAQEFPVEIVFPRNYPDSEPLVFDRDRIFKPFPGKKIEDRHICENGKFCLWIPPASKWNPEDPETLLVFLDEVAMFLERQIIYDLNGIWPGREYQHNVLGYLQFIRELLGNDEVLFNALRPVLAGEELIGRNDPCPCGLGPKFKRCHWPKVQEIEQLVGTRNTRIACRYHGASTSSAALAKT